MEFEFQYYNFACAIVVAEYIEINDWNRGKGGANVVLDLTFNTSAGRVENKLLSFQPHFPSAPMDRILIVLRESACEYMNNMHYVGKELQS